MQSYRVGFFEALEARALLNAGDLNLAFGGGDGKLRFDPPVAGGVVVNVVAQPHGKFVIGGSAVHGHRKFYWLERFNAAGRIDQSFGTNGAVILEVGNNERTDGDFVRQPDGKLVVVTTTKTGGIMARFTSAGTLDPAFGGGDGIVTTRYPINRVSILPNHRIAAVSEGHVIEFHSDGSINNSFGVRGVFKIPIHVVAITVQKDNKLVLGGFMPAPFVQADGALLRLTSSGQRDKRFGANGLVDISFGFDTQYVVSVAVQSTGRIIAALFDDADNGYVLGFKPDGSRDPLFHGGQQNFSSQNEDEVDGISLFSNDRILLFGAVSTNTDITQHDFAAIGLASSGRKQFQSSADFSSPSVEHDDIPSAAAQTASGDILIVGNADGDRLLQVSHSQIDIALLHGS